MLLVAATLAGCPRISSDGARPRPRPNVILIVVDDLGYGDLGAYGSTNETPAIDRLAGEGIRLTGFYATAPVCTPSRASLLTGSYPRRVGLSGASLESRVLRPDAPLGLSPAEVTLPEILGPLGYRSACIGKWHLGTHPSFRPRAQGFDHHFGVLQISMPEGRRPLYRDGELVRTWPRKRDRTRLYTEEAVDFIRRNRRGPFFLYLAHEAMHVPVRPGAAFEGISGRGPYGDMVAELDWSTGTILETLTELGIDDQTLVILTSDNGAGPEGSNAPLRGGKGQFLEGGVRVPFLARWPGSIPAGAASPELATVMDILPTLADVTLADLPERPIDGASVWPILRGDETAASPHDAFAYYQNGRLRAVRVDGFKLHLAEGRLFDLERDPGEGNDRADEHPEIVSRLRAIAERFRDELGDGSRIGKGQRATGIAPAAGSTAGTPPEASDDTS